MAYKHDYDKILTRLTTILKRLNDGEVLRIKDLEKYLNALKISKYINLIEMNNICLILLFPFNTILNKNWIESLQ